MKFTSILGFALAFVAVVQARFGQEHTPKADATYQAVRDISQGTGKEEQAGNLSGAMVRALLAKAPTCDQQDRADEIIDLGISVGGEKKKKFIKIAKKYRQLERNTPGKGQPSKLCNKAPRHKELDGLVQAQDPTGKSEITKLKREVAKLKNQLASCKESKPPKEKRGSTQHSAESEKKKLRREIKKLQKQLAFCKKSKPPPKEEKSKNYAETHPVGGVKMPKIERVDDDYVVKGNKFNGDLDAAHNRQCDIQHNLCFNKFNSGDRSFTGEDCEKQNPICKDGPPVFAN